MIRDAASSSACSGASAGGSALPSDGSPQIQPARPRSGPHPAAAGSPASDSLSAGSVAPGESASFTPPVSPGAISTSNHLSSKHLCPERTEDHAGGHQGWSRRFSGCGVLPILLGRTPRSLTGNVAAGAELAAETARRRRRGGGGEGCDGDHTG